MRDNLWHDDRLERLKALYAEGLPLSGIAAALNSEFPGSGLTRSAIGGKLHRLGLKTRVVRPRKPKAGKAGKFGAGKLVNHGHYFKIAEGYPGVEEAKADPEAFVHRCGIMELENCSCRWPVGDSQSKEFFFCGAPGADLFGHRPYCSYHERIAAPRGG